MNQVKALETLKAIKRMARSQYNCSRIIYSEKLIKSPNEQKIIYFEAITALDAVHHMYEQMKTEIRKEPFADQINFAKNWGLYINCIDSITAHRTKDKYLLRSLAVTEESFAKQKALEIWKDFSKLNTGKLWQTSL